MFVLDPCFFAAARARRLPHRMQFMLESLVVLDQSLAHLGSQLVGVAGKRVELILVLPNDGTWTGSFLKTGGEVAQPARDRSNVRHRWPIQLAGRKSDPTTIDIR